MVAAASVVLTFLVAAPVVYGGLRWSGFDPAIRLADGTVVNIEIGMPPGQWCQIDGPIGVMVSVPQGSGAAVVFEQPATESNCYVTTSTTIDEGNTDGAAYVGVDVEAKGNFPVDVVVSINGAEVRTCSSKAGDTVQCGPIDLN